MNDSGRDSFGAMLDLSEHHKACLNPGTQGSSAVAKACGLGQERGLNPSGLYQLKGLGRPLRNSEIQDLNGQPQCLVGNWLLHAHQHTWHFHSKSVLTLLHWFLHYFDFFLSFWKYSLFVLYILARFYPRWQNCVGKLLFLKGPTPAAVAEAKVSECDSDGKRPRCSTETTHKQ